MMIRMLLAISMFCLLALSSGLTLQVHYCMNQVAEVSIFSSADHTCNSCGMQEEKEGCCHQEKQLVKLTHDQFPPYFATYNIAPALAFVGPLVYPSLSALASENGVMARIDPVPPDNSSPPLFIKNRVFRI